MFTRGRLGAAFFASRRGIRKADTFVVAYPKSGGSWFCTLMANVLKGPSQDYSDLWSATKQIPDINGIYFSGKPLDSYGHMPDPRFFFVHAPYEPLLPKVVYVLRDVRDVLVSYYHWLKMKRGTLPVSLQEFVAKDDLWPCPWDKHVTGWLLANHRVPLMTVRYEDLLRNTAKELIRALEFCGISHTNNEVAGAVEASSFERMRQAEECNEEYNRTKADKAERFVRHGRAGQWKEELDEACIRVIESKYGRTLHRLGYF